MTSKEGQPKKVRIACHRCRVRRIKCDGQLPACGNCSKARLPCIDVGGRNTETLIPRSFPSNAKARIDWLEDVIRQHLPQFDLSTGPKVDLTHVDALLEGAEQKVDGVILETAADGHGPSDSKSLQSWSNDVVPLGPSLPKSPFKRSYSFAAESEKERHFSDEVRSVAKDLGMLSLNTDSRQRHYLGSSSGLLFTRLIEADDESRPSAPQSVHSARHSSWEPQSSTPKLRFVGQARPMTQADHSLYNRLRSNLPAKEDALYLVQTYFRQIHPEHPIIHPPSLLSALEALYECTEAGDDFNIIESGWPEDMTPFAFNGELDTAASKIAIPITIHVAAFHVFMVLNLAATLRTRARVFEFAPAQFYRTAMSVSQECFSGISLASLQAVLLLTIHALLAPAEMNIWTLAHISMAHCIDIGLHREPKSRDESPAARNTRRFVFYSVYSLDRSIATIQGRPLGIRDETFDVRFPTAEDQDVEDAGSFGGGASMPSYSGTLPYSSHRFGLDRIISEIKLLFYHLPTRMSSIQWPTNIEDSQKRLYSELENWCSQIQQVVDAMVLIDEMDRRQWYIRLELQYFATVVLLFQPSQVLHTPSDDALLLCFQASVRQIRGYNTLHEHNALYPSWRVVQGIFGSGATLIYCFWTSRLVRSSPTASEMPRILRMCSNLLSIGGECWPSAKQGKLSFEKIVDLTLERMSDKQTRTLSQRAKRPSYGPRVQTDQVFDLMAPTPSHGGTQSTIGPDVGSFLSNASTATAPQYHEECYEELPESPFGFNMDPGQAYLSPSRPSGLGYHTETSDDVQPTGQSTRYDQSPSLLGDRHQSFLEGSLDAIDPEIQGFLAEFWTSNPSWSGFDVDEPLSFI